MITRTPKEVFLLLLREQFPESGAPEDDAYITDWKPEHLYGSKCGDPTCPACWIEDYTKAETRRPQSMDRELRAAIRDWADAQVLAAAGMTDTVAYPVVENARLALMRELNRVGL